MPCASPDETVIFVPMGRNPSAVVHAVNATTGALLATSDGFPLPRPFDENLFAISTSTDGKRVLVHEWAGGAYSKPSSHYYLWDSAHNTLTREVSIDTIFSMVFAFLPPFQTANTSTFNIGDGAGWLPWQYGNDKHSGLKGFVPGEPGGGFQKILDFEPIYINSNSNYWQYVFLPDTAGKILFLEQSEGLVEMRLLSNRGVTLWAYRIRETQYAYPAMDSSSNIYVHAGGLLQALGSTGAARQDVVEVAP